MLGLNVFFIIYGLLTIKGAAPVSTRCVCRQAEQFTTKEVYLLHCERMAKQREDGPELGSFQWTMPFSSKSERARAGLLLDAHPDQGRKGSQSVNQVKRDEQLGPPALTQDAPHPISFFVSFFCVILVLFPIIRSGSPFSPVRP